MSPAVLHPIVVFDLDGTLVDTAPDLIETLNVIFSRERIPLVSIDDARNLVGAGIRPLIAKALEEQGRQCASSDIDLMFADYVKHYAAHIADRSRPYPGVENALDLLAKDGFRLAVCTNKLEWLAILLLEKLSMSQRFAAICGQDTFAVMKPHPDALRHTIAAAGGDLACAVMVGDSQTDVAIARAAGIPVIGVDFGYTPIPMAALMPDRVIGHFDLLATAIGELIPEAPKNRR